MKLRLCTRVLTVTALRDGTAGTDGVRRLRVDAAVRPDEDRRVPCPSVWEACVKSRVG